MRFMTGNSKGVSKWLRSTEKSLHGVGTFRFHAKLCSTYKEFQNRVFSQNRWTLSNLPHYWCIGTPLDIRRNHQYLRFLNYWFFSVRRWKGNQWPFPTWTRPIKVGSTSISHRERFRAECFENSQTDHRPLSWLKSKRRLLSGKSYVCFSMAWAGKSAPRITTNLG